MDIKDACTSDMNASYVVNINKSTTTTATKAAPVKKKRSPSDDDTKTGTTSSSSDEWKTDWTSVYIVTLVSFIGAVHQNCINVWPYLRQIDETASETFYGLMRSVAGVGGITSALVSGVACNWLQDTRWPMIFGKVMAVISCILYVSIETMSSSQKFAFLIFELFMGISGGAANIYRVHIAHNSTEKDRPKAVGICSLAPGLGLLAGPRTMLSAILVLQLTFTLIDYPGWPLLFGTHINLYTAPMLVTIVISIIGTLLLLFYFDGRMHVDPNACVIFEQVKNPGYPAEYQKAACKLEKKRSTVNAMTATAAALSVDVEGRNVLSESSSSTTTTDSRTAGGQPTTYTKFDYTAAALCMFTRAVINLALLTFIIIGSPYMMMTFRWTSAETIKYQSILLFLIGLHIILWNLVYIFFDFQAKAIVLAVGILFSCFIATYPWPFIGETIQYRKIAPSEIFANGSNAADSLGCAPDVEWCAHTPAVNMYLFLTSIVVTLGVCIPLSSINLDILFSKVLGCGVKQGTMQALFVVCGDGLNIFVPVIISYVYSTTGLVYLWQFIMVMILVCMALWAVFYARMISNTRRCENIRRDVSAAPSPTRPTRGWPAGQRSRRRYFHKRNGGSLCISVL